MTKKPTPSQKAKRSSPQARSKKPTQVTLVASKTPLRHFRLVGHAHSGKVVHRRHTSHVALMLMLLFVGAMLALSQQMSTALTNSGSVTVGAVVNGPPPTVGATITSPADGTDVRDEAEVTISGTCAPTTFVVLYNRGVLAGSTNCTVAGIFSLTATLTAGENIFTALNFDNVNQPGPATGAVRVNVIASSQESAPAELPTLPELTLPANPSLIPGLPDLGWWCGQDESGQPAALGGNQRIVAQACSVPQDCTTYDAGQEITSGGPLSISVVCFPRILQKNQLYTAGIIIRGGVPPYALNIDFGSDDEDSLSSFATPGYKTVSFRYTNTGAFNKKFSVTDSQGEKVSAESGVQVNGEGQSLITTVAEVISPENWFTSPVPLYVVAVVMTLAFWGGDIFDRRFGSHKRPHSRGRKRAA